MMILDSKSLDSLSLDLVKDHLQVLDTSDDNLIQMYVDASLSIVEKHINCPITSETYSSEVNALPMYEIPYKPQNVYLYQNSTLIAEVPFTYSYPTLTLDIPTDTPAYNLIKADVQGENTKAIDQARLLLIGSFFRVRENEDFSNMTETPWAVTRLLNLHTKYRTC